MLHFDKLFWFLKSLKHYFWAIFKHFVNVGPPFWKYIVGTLFVQFDADYFLAALSNLEDDKR